jgi:uroporphyrinogen-III synthase
VTRPEDHGGRLSTLLRERGARPLSLPVTALAPPRDPGPLRSAARRIASYHWIIVTSRNAVDPLVGALETEGTLEVLTAARTVQPSDATGTRPRICAVGPGTAAALEGAGLPWTGSRKTDMAGYTAEGVVAALSDEAEGLRILYPRAEGARAVIPRELGVRGAGVDAVEAYRSVDDREGARALVRGVDRGEVDVITFAAGSGVRSFARAWRGDGSGGRAPMAPRRGNRGHRAGDGPGPERGRTPGAWHR